MSRLSVTNKKVRRIFDDTGKTQADFAKAIGVSRHTVEAWFKPESSRSFRCVPATTLRLIQELAMHEGFYQ